MDRGRSRIDLSIGGLRFLADAPRGFSLVEDDPCYLPFLDRPEEQPGEIRIPVNLEMEAAPDVEGLPVLFDTGEAWIAYRTPTETLLSLRAARGPDPYLWLARLPAALDTAGVSVRLHCGHLLSAEAPLKGGLVNPLRYPLDQILTMIFLAPADGLICHAAGLSANGRGVLLAGVSGAGKTTIMRCAAGHSGMTGLSDDRLIVRATETGIAVAGTPWAGEGRIASASEVPLAALVFLRQAGRNELRPITTRHALESLLRVTSIPWFDGGMSDRVLELCGRLVEELPAFELDFLPEPAALDHILPLF